MTTNTLSEKALIVNLAISQFTGRKLDKQATATVESSYKTQARVGNYTKKLLPGAKELEEITRIAGNLRVWFYANSLPWMTDGSRIIKSSSYMDFTSEFRTRKGQFDAAVSAFITAFPDLMDNAKHQLGDLWNYNEYPSVSKLHSLFNCDVSFMPVPALSDFRISLSDDEKTNFTNQMQNVEREAMKEVWNRLYQVVSKATDKLKLPKDGEGAIFRDSLIENIQEMCQLLPRLNITDDAELEKMRQEVETIAANINPEMCRVSDKVREQSAEALEDITSKMSAFMGA